MQVLSGLIGVAVGALIAVAYVPDAEAQRRGGGGGGRPVAAFPGAKPTTGGHHWRGGHHGGWSGRDHGGWSGRHQGGWSGRHDGWSGRHHGGWSGRHHGRHHGHRHHHRGHGWWPLWGVGVGIGLGWPYWGYGWGWPYSGVPVGIVDGPVYVNPDPMPVYGEPPYRWYCPASAAYYPVVRECTRPWLKVIPSDIGPVAPPTSDDRSSPSDAAEPSDPAQPALPRDPPPPASSIAPRPGTLDAPDATAANGHVRIAAPRMAPPAQLVASHDRARRSMAASNAAAQDAMRSRDSLYEAIAQSESR